MTKKFTQAMAVVKARLAQNLEEGIALAAMALQAESQKLCPVDTGALRASAFSRKEGTPDQVVWKVGYTQYYAVYVHEGTHMNFKVGQAKFLEEPARLLADELGEIMVSKVEKNS